MMMKYLRHCAMIHVIALSACGNGHESEAKEAVKALLTDPSSAEFRQVQAFDGDVVCGSVNAKNQMGGYVGFKRFIFNGADLGKVEIPALPSHITFWCANSSNKRTAFRKYQSDEKWKFLIRAETLCEEVVEAMPKQIWCEAATKARSTFKPPQ